MKNFMVLALALVCFAGCNKDASTDKAGSKVASDKATVVAAEPEEELKADPGTSFTIMYKESLQYQGYVALTGPKAIQFAIKNDARESIVPQLETATISVPAISASGLAGKPNDMNEYFSVELPQPVTLPTSVTLNFKVNSDDEAYAVDLLLQ